MLQPSAEEKTFRWEHHKGKQFLAIGEVWIHVEWRMARAKLRAALSQHFHGLTVVDAMIFVEDHRGDLDIVPAEPDTIMASA